MAAAEHNLPTRSMTADSDDEVVSGDDSSEVTRLFQERLRAYKHACGYLEEYIKATEKMQHAHGKEYEKVLKTVSNPLKEAHHFDQELGGIAGLFENIRSNTQGISNAHYETAKTLKGQILPTFERLHAEIKNKTKELTKGAGKQSKVVDKARGLTQKHIELLGSHTATFSSAGGLVAADKDPYVLQRGVYHRLNKQIIEENNNRSDLITVQNSFAQFEAHVIEVFQQGLGAFLNVVTAQSEKDKAMYGDMVGTAHQIPPNFEWDGFVRRNNNILIDPNSPPRNVHNVSFPNQHHPSTQPLISGSLERKGNVNKLKKSTAFYVITPSKYLHEFETDDDFTKDPTPENSLYLPDCSVGYLDGQKFTVKGKDVSKGMLGMKGLATHEYKFKAHTAQDAAAWYEVIRKAAGQVTNERPSESEPNSPAPSKTATGLSDGSEPAAAPADTKAAEAGYAGEVAGAGHAAPAAPAGQTTGTIGHAPA